MTLVEVLAATVLLGTLLSAVMVARGTIVRQAARAANALEACDVLDAQMARWTAAGGVPANARGEVALCRPWLWRTRVVRSLGEPFYKNVVLVEVWNPHAEGAQAGIEVLR